MSLLGRPAFYCPQYGGPPNCELLLHFDETSPGAWTDSSIQNHPIGNVQFPVGSSVTDPGPPIVIRPFSSILSSVPGRFNNAAQFTPGFPGNGGSPAYEYNTACCVTVANDVALAANEFFLSLLVDIQTYAPASGGYLNLLSNREGNYPFIDGWYLNLVYVSGTVLVPQFGATIRPSGGPYTANLNGGASYPVTAGFQHIAASRTLNVSPGLDTICLFLNGTIVNSIAINTGDAFTAPSSTLRIGTDQFSTMMGIEQRMASFGGAIDEVFIIKGVGTGVNTAFTVPPTPYSGQPFRPWLGL